MRQRPRIHYTESQKALMWERWRQGESLQKIALLVPSRAFPGVNTISPDTIDLAEDRLTLTRFN
jgi:hypothetical protein